MLATAIPTTATFFMTYVLTSGWASLACELLQPMGLLCNLFYRYILRNKDESSYGIWTFPYHTEIPRLALFGLMGFTCSIMAPLILPLLLVYFFLAYLVYRNQILNVYATKYQTGGLYWPVVHNAVIFSLILTQIIALAVFGLKRSTVASCFTIPLIILTVLFHEYCRQKYFPVFKSDAAQILIEMDQQDEQSGRMAEIHQKLPYEYCQFTKEGLHNLEATCDTNSEIEVVTCETNGEIEVVGRVEELEISPGKLTVPLPGVGPSKLDTESPHGE